MFYASFKKEVLQRKLMAYLNIIDDSKHIKYPFELEKEKKHTHTILKLSILGLSKNQMASHKQVFAQSVICTQDTFFRRLLATIYKPSLEDNEEELQVFPTNYHLSYS